MSGDDSLRIVQLTPGAGKMFCGACMRDNALAASLRRLGHAVTMVPLYLPMTLDEDDQTAGVPFFFSGINVFLDQQFPLFCKSPAWAAPAAGFARVVEIGLRPGGRRPN